MKSGDGARVAYPLFQEEDGGANPTSPLQLRIIKISPSKAQELNSLWHSRLPVYETGSCLHGICFGALFSGIFYAVAIWSNPVARALPQREWLELRRLAISDDAPKNTASRILSVMTSILKSSYPHLEKLISYQDMETHKGTIYKAAGWVVGSEHKGGTWYRPNSHNKSGSPRLRPDNNQATGPKIRWEKDLV